MLRRWVFRFVMAAIAALMIVTPVFAGGWAVVTLDQMPAQISAGQPIPIGFTVRQHGRTLRDDLAPIIRLDRMDAKESFTVTATASGQAGHYAATLIFPSAGKWTWRIDIEAFGMVTQPLPELTVQAAAPAGSKIVEAVPVGARPKTASPFAAIVDAIRALAVAVSKAVATSPAAPTDLAQRGQDLFLAKGCAMCHTHAAVGGTWTDFGPVEIGPDLTHRKLDPDYLRRWLKDPSAVKPDTQMPMLNLSDQEIEALVAFLLEDTSSAPAASTSCPVTPASDERPPDQHLAEWAPQDEWYRSPDGNIWVAQNNIAGIPVGEMTKVLWGKPTDLELTVTGRRLDGDAPPLLTDVSPYYREQNINPSGIGFSAPGCWEIEARAGKSVLRIVVNVP